VTHVLLLLGSNIDREANFCRAARRLAELVHVVAFSPVYETEPMGDPDQPCFLNAVALVATELAPEEIKTRAIDRIEQDLGRRRGPNKNAPRTIDLDIILYGDQVLSLGGRRIPDPELLRYPHIARPAADVAPDWAHPQTGDTLRAIADRLAQRGIRPRPDIVLENCTAPQGEAPCHHSK
jgi:2-amino-4-hydroxy-6-hydroxymethyldihydropteridine diphosphokinase